ncbi:hypothetical protein AWZ03_006128 [Drosophila navojoa]|uniref:CHK kinase-like domain-containing protein n=1 Tax=Drosophila navojoa TaxID=7232 RepID=A0A484BH92_DRONA|nr:uncharacterized protein LOC115562441 [Drosophila navojoa]TDG47400.1 hypothetical protein AWZ03_006128 [Drosophila navojoa]
MTSNNDDYNSDELEAPAWMNKQFFQEVLVEHLKEPSLTVSAVRISPASVKGDHYASVMFRANVEYSSEKRKCSKSLIIKTMPEMDGHKKEFVSESKIFQTEIEMYTEVLPRFEEILRAAGEDTKFCATCVYYSMQPRQIMIFEDLLPLGYVVIRNRNATLDELRAALAKLAKWHAVSFKLLEEQPGIFDRLQYDITTMPNLFELEVITSALPNFINMISQEDSLKTYRKYFEPMRENILSRWQDVLREYRQNRQANAYYVLCHGDFHIRNIMFKDNDCMLIDFQMSSVGSIANDLQYAKYMLLSGDDRKDKWDEILYHYFDTFTRTLSKIGYKGQMPSLVELRQQIFDRRSTDYFLLTTFLPGSYSMRKGKDPGEFMNNERLRLELYQDKDYKQELEYLLPQMLHLGYFEPPK